jgi:DNA-directed RNA polymerase II subunit RPB1
MIIVQGDDDISREAQENARKLFNIHMSYLLSPKKIILKHHLTDQAFDWLLEEIK